MLPHSSKHRLRRVLAICGGVLLVGGLYGLICNWLGFGIPCLLYRLTGLKCPGCGVSRMCLSLLRLDFAGAWQYNPAILALLPLGLGLALHVVVRYVKSGKHALTAGENAVVWFMVAVLLIFGVLRNLL